MIGDGFAMMLGFITTGTDFICKIEAKKNNDNFQRKNIFNIRNKKTINLLPEALVVFCFSRANKFLWWQWQYQHQQLVHQNSQGI